MAMSAAFFATPHNSYTLISGANPNRDGVTGVYADALVAASTGTKIERVIVSAIATTTAGFVRLWVFKSTQCFLLREVPVTAVVPSGTVAAFRAEVDFTSPSQILVLASGDHFQVTTHNAESFHITVIGADA